MNYTKIFLLTLFAILSITPYSFGQKPTSQNSKSKIQTNKSETEIPKGWKLIDLGSFSFILPESMEDKKVRGIDSQFWNFANDEIELYIDSGMYKVNFEEDADNYATEPQWIKIDGIKGRLFKINFLKNKSLEDDNNESVKAEEKQFLNGILFYRGENFYSSFWIRFDKKEQNEIVDKIFQSIKFKK